MESLSILVFAMIVSLAAFAGSGLLWLLARRARRGTLRAGAMADPAVADPHDYDPHDPCRSTPPQP